MRNLLAIWREHGIDVLLREAWESGVVLAGISAGAMCWFQNGITRSAGSPAPAAGLGFLPGSMSVHCDGDPSRLPVFLDAIARGVMPDGYAADDGVGLLFDDEQLVRVVSSRPGARAYRVQRAARGRDPHGHRARAARGGAVGLRRDVPRTSASFAPSATARRPTLSAESGVPPDPPLSGPRHHPPPTTCQRPRPSSPPLPLYEASGYSLIWLRR